MIHINCGHPAKAEMIRALRLSGAKPKVLKYVRDEFPCSACQARGTLPAPRPPAALPKTFRFNDIVGVDLSFIKDHKSETRIITNIVCFALFISSV